MKIMPVGKSFLYGGKVLLPSHIFTDNRNHICFCHRSMMMFSMEVDVFLYLSLLVIGIGNSPKIRMSGRYWTKTEHLVHNSLQDLKASCLKAIVLYKK